MLILLGVPWLVVALVAAAVSAAALHLSGQRYARVAIGVLLGVQIVILTAIVVLAVARVAFPVYLSTDYVLHAVVVFFLLALSGGIAGVSMTRRPRLRGLSPWGSVIFGIATCIWAILPTYPTQSALRGRFQQKGQTFGQLGRMFADDVSRYTAADLDLVLYAKQVKGVTNYPSTYNTLPPPFSTETARMLRIPGMAARVAQYWELAHSISPRSRIVVSDGNVVIKLPCTDDGASSQGTYLYSTAPDTVVPVLPLYYGARRPMALPLGHHWYAFRYVDYDVDAP